MKVLITGGSSLLGKALLETVPGQTQTESTWYTNYVMSGMLRLDITDDRQVKYVLSNVKPDVIIHCAGIAAVDYSELYVQETRISNVIGTQNIISAAKLLKAKLVYISTNAVFDGENAPYKEDDKCRPISLYGKIKKEVEDTITSEMVDYLIIRPILLYGWPWMGGRQNWVTRVIQSLERGLSVKMVDDTVSQPLYVKNCAETIWQLLKQNQRGIYHLGGPETMSLYDLAIKTADLFGLDDSLISRASSNDFKTLAPRPRDTHFCLDKVMDLGIKLTNIEDGLIDMKNSRNMLRLIQNQIQNGRNYV